MENRPVISITAMSRAPGADKDLFERFQKWQTEVYVRISVKLPGIVGVNSYRSVRVTPEYPKTMSIGHYLNLKARQNYAIGPENTSIVQELKAWTDRGIAEQVWSNVYVFIKGFRSGTSALIGNETTWTENAPIAHLEAYRLSPAEQEKYYKWFDNFGCNVFMPLFMKMPGLLGYDWFEYTGICRKQNVREQDYPKYLSIIYFKDQDSFEKYAQSPELASFQKGMRSVFPCGLKLEWYVQYQLFDSQKK